MSVTVDGERVYGCIRKEGDVAALAWEAPEKQNESKEESLTFRFGLPTGRPFGSGYLLRHSAPTGYEDRNPLGVSGTESR